MSKKPLMEIYADALVIDLYWTQPKLSAPREPVERLRPTAGAVAAWKRPAAVDVAKME
jgi:hypothetical protein